MIERTVKRYYCDHCKRSRARKNAIISHESKCTMNPARICGFCDLLQQEQPDLLALRGILPKREDFKTGAGGFFDGMRFEEAVLDALPRLSDAAGGCPACILAALRQERIFLPPEHFSYNTWADRIFRKVNAERSEGIAFGGMD